MPYISPDCGYSERRTSAVKTAQPLLYLTHGAGWTHEIDETTTYPDRHDRPMWRRYSEEQDVRVSL